MTLPLNQAALNLPASPYYRESKEFCWREQLSSPGIHTQPEPFGPVEAAARLRELADYIEKNTKEGKRPEPDDATRY